MEIFITKDDSGKYMAMVEWNSKEGFNTFDEAKNWAIAKHNGNFNDVMENITAQITKLSSRRDKLFEGHLAFLASPIKESEPDEHKRVYRFKHKAD